MTTGAVVQEFPELDNPLGKARGAMQGFETQLAEEQDALERTKGKVDKAKEAVAEAEAAVVACEAQVAAIEAQLAEAEAALGDILADITAGKRDADGQPVEEG